MPTSTAHFISYNTLALWFCEISHMVQCSEDDDDDDDDDPLTQP